jgi:hypothetical protein
MITFYFRLCELSLFCSLFGHRESFLLLAAFSFLMWTARKAHAFGGEL